MASSYQDSTRETLAALPAYQGLFPTHPLAHNRIIAITGKDKSAPVISRGATGADYFAHLSPDAYDGVGALGIYPTLPLPDEQGRARWSCLFLALDFDSTPPLDLIPMVDTLESHDVYAYATCGTTGRGSHLYFFLEQPVPQRLAYGFLKATQTLAVEAGLPLPEIRPSNESTRGSAIFLPYRGAFKDGLGYNPLLDPDRDLMPIRLRDVPDIVRRTPIQTLMVVRTKVPPYRPPKPDLATRVSVNAPELGGTPTGSLELLLRELERVASSFVSPYRQHLVLGLTAYGLVGLGLDEATVAEEVMKFVRSRDPDELEKRRSALDQTIKNFRRDPYSVAWRLYYDEAGLFPPGKPGISEEVRVRLESVTNTFQARQWQGIAGATDRSVYAALSRVADAHGTVHERGVAVSISTRDLALRAKVSHKTVRTSLTRLQKESLVVREHQGKRSPKDAGTLVLLIEEGSKLPHSIPSKGGQKEWGHLYTHSAFRHGKLSKSAVPLLIALAQATRPLTRSELARALRKESRDVRKALEKLVTHAIVIDANGLYTLSEKWEVALERAAVVTGALAAQERQKRLYAHDREVWHERLERLNTRGLYCALADPPVNITLIPEGGEVRQETYSNALHV